MYSLEAEHLAACTQISVMGPICLLKLFSDGDSNHSSGFMCKRNTEGKKHIGYDQSQRRAYLDDFITNYHSLHASKFYREKGLSRQTVRGWCSNREQILHDKIHFLRKDIQELEEQEYTNAHLYGFIKSKLTYHRIKRKGADHTPPETILAIDDSDSDSSRGHVSGGSLKQEQVYAKLANPSSVLTGIHT